MRIRDGKVQTDTLDACSDCKIREKCEDFKTYAMLINTMVIIVQFCEEYT